MQLVFFIYESSSKSNVTNFINILLIIKIDMLFSEMSTFSCDALVSFGHQYFEDDFKFLKHLSLKPSSTVFTQVVLYEKFCPYNDFLSSRNSQKSHGAVYRVEKHLDYCFVQVISHLV